MTREWHPNLQILANAGSGKTHTLITRIIRLLVIGVDPRRIIALTFTRKAAGEFFSKLLQRLAMAALDSKAAGQLSRDIQLDRDCADYQRVLRKIVHDLGKLQLTTLDSFFNRVVATFPQELGLAAPPCSLDPYAQELAGKASLRHALGKLGKQETTLLLQSLFERDEGSAPRSASYDLSHFRQEIHDTYLAHPEPGAWGNPERIWGTLSNPWTALSLVELATCRDIIAQEIGSPEFPAKAKTAWDQLLLLTRGTKTNAIVSKILDSLDLWKAGTGAFDYYRKNYQVSSKASKAAAALASHYLYECTEYRLREARTMHHLLSLYETTYDTEVRSRGMLTFSDVTRLLQPKADFMGLGRESNSDSDALRLQLDERLDALFDHWLLDEFQDTSRGQYRALENILDEVISEAAQGGEQSFFCVGDIKQAIYGWREGDSRLFEELYQRYRMGNGLLRKPLADSWRSSEVILSTLNAIFGDLEATAPTLPPEVKERWTSAWTQHHRSDTLAPLPGYFSWQTNEGNDEEASVEERVIELLKTMQSHLKEGMTIALLVRTGDEAQEWLEILRHAGIEALSESTPSVGCDNPVAAALRSALSLSVHPSDQFARNHLLMEPLRSIFFPSDDAEHDLALLVCQSAKLIAEGGMSGVTTWVLNRLSPLVQDEFSKGRSAALLRAARKADHSGIVSLDDFLTFLEEYEEPGRAAPQAVQIMTIHKAKGLEYDMVVIPFSDTQTAINSLNSPQLHKHQNKQGEPFLITLPAEEIRSVPGNEVLAQAATQQRSDKAFEELCVWYVALSRARQALYLFSREPKKLEAGKCPTFPQLLKAGLDTRFEFQDWQLGDPYWFQKFSRKHSELELNPLPVAIPISPRTRSLQKSTPSTAAHQILRGEQSFLESNATALGLEIHSIFESIDWLPTELPEKTTPEAQALIETCLDHPSMKELFRKPHNSFTLWHEQRFDLILDEVWISGAFDRVVIFRDDQGCATHADLIDFKTDQGGGKKLLLNYRSQLESYRRALGSILNLPLEKIRAILIHVRSADPVMILS